MFSSQDETFSFGIEEQKFQRVVLLVSTGKTIGFSLQNHSFPLAKLFVLTCRNCIGDKSIVPQRKALKSAVKGVGNYREMHDDIEKAQAVYLPTLCF